jgi:DNA-binding MarR family transcriptional regulator
VPTRTINLSRNDLESVQRLLTSLTEAEPHRAGPDGEIAKHRLISVARASLSVRRRRSEYLHRAMLGEPAYDMLLGLYVAEADGQSPTAARLADLAGVAQSSALRWIEYLIAKELVVRERHPSHKRASILQLSDKGRAALEGVVKAILDGIQEAMI